MSDTLECANCGESIILILETELPVYEAGARYIHTGRNNNVRCDGLSYQNDKYSFDSAEKATPYVKSNNFKSLYEKLSN